MIPSQTVYAVLAVVLFAGLVATLVFLWRWFVARRAVLSEQIGRRWARLLAHPVMVRLRNRYPRLWRFLTARFARGEYLGLHLTIGLALSLVGLWIFGGVTEDVVHHDPLTHFDLTLSNWLQAHSSPSTLAIGRAMSLLGSPLVIGTLALAVALWLAVRRQWMVLAGWLVAFLGGSLLNAALKDVIHRPRPIHASALHYSSWSFPSGHAMESLIGYGMLAYVLILLVPAMRARPVPLVIGTTAIVLAIGISRLLLGVHYFSDVIGGYAAGTLWLAACISGLEVVRRWRAGIQNKLFG